MPDVGGYRSRHLPRTATAQPRRDGDVLLAVHRVRHWKALNRRAETRLPEDLPRFHVERAEMAIEIARERHATGGGKDCGQERRPLLIAPDFPHRVDIERGQ